MDLAGVPRVSDFPGRFLDEGALSKLSPEGRRFRRLPLPGLRADRRRREHRSGVHPLPQPRDDRRRHHRLRHPRRVPLPYSRRRATTGVSTPPAIETEGLGRDYGSVRALRALDLLVPAGALVGLLGPNGAGKTTAMLLLATILAPSRGTARIFGADVRRERIAVRRRLGLVFQETSIDGLLTVEENLRFAARLSGLGGPKVRAAVAAALDRAGLRPRASQPARQLSGG